MSEETMEDTLIKGRIKALDIAFQYAVTTNVANEVVLRHDCDPVAAHLLVRSLTAGLLAAAPAAQEERINIRWSYHGALSAIVVDAGQDGTVRGLINPSQLGTTETIEELYGNGGEICVVRSCGGKVLASGTIEPCFMDVVDDLAAFLCISDQVESSAAVMVGFDPNPQRPVSLARGIMLQALPGANLDRFQGIRSRLHVPDVRGLLADPAEHPKYLDQLLKELVGDDSESSVDWNTSGDTWPVFKCTCGPDKMDAAVRCLSYADRVDIVQKKEPVKMRCHFCNEAYELTVEDCIRAWNQPQGSDKDASGA